jgi:integrating conjugative element relaxase (TIGR03760 family)
MRLLFRRRKSPRTADTPPPPHAPAGLTVPMAAAALLATPRRQRLLDQIWQRTSLSRPQFDALYLAPIERYAELVQQFPASEAHHHAYLGGMLDHGLEVVALVLKLRQSRLLPAGSPPEVQALQAGAWTAGAAYAALLHDIGKIAVDLEVQYANGATWHPWHGPMRQPYRFRYRAGRQYRLHGACAGLLYTRVLDTRILDWLSGISELWPALLYMLAGQPEHAGILGELVAQADQASAAQALGGDPHKALAAPRHSLQRQVLDGLRHLVRDDLSLNAPGPADGWLTEDALWLVSKTVCDKLRAHLLAQGIDRIPSNNTMLFNVLQDHGIVLPAADGKAIWRATVTAVGGWSHTFTLLRVVPSLIWDEDQRPAAFAGSVSLVADEATANETATAPAAPTQEDAHRHEHPPQVHPQVATAATSPDSVETLLSLLALPSNAHASRDEPPSQAATPIETSATTSPSTRHAQGVRARSPSTTAPTDPSGEHFLAWLRDRIQERKLIINDARALVHTVDDSVFLVTPGLFQRYAQEHPIVAARAKADDLQDWRWVQKRFEKLQLHRKQTSGLNIWTCGVTGPRKSRRLHGYLLKEPTRVLTQPLPDNPYLKLINDNS